MLREFKFLRRNSGKNSIAEEVENVPLNPSDSLNPQISTNPSRPPFNTIQDPPRIPKSISDHDLSGFKPNKVNRTPTKPKPKYSDTQVPLRTPEKQGVMLKNRFNWAQKGEYQSANSVIDPKEEGRVLVSNTNTPTPSSSRGVGRANLSNSECNSTQTTPTKSVSKPPNPGFSFANGARHVSNMGARMANYAALSKGNPGSCNLPTVVNTVEVPYFELKEDSSFWMEHNVQVLIRVRPLNNMEKSSFGYSRCLKQENAQSITWIGQPETRFIFDHVACEAIDQETLFRMVGLPMVENCLSGYNSCMFAYGQTGSGKTFTMLGEIEELEVRPSPNRGMTPRIFEFLFARIRAEEESRRDERLKYSCKCSFLEIYNEQITDLLDPSSTNLMLREDMKNGVYVENLSEFEVHTVGDILQLLTQGSSNRKVAATNMNRESSRSHSVFTCVIESRWEKDTATNFRFARLNLVDLAGSERQKSSGAEGERLKEAANINKSLSTLGHVIMVLVDVANGKPRHIPYRDSRLTFLLQDSLGGNSKTMIIANVSPSICSAAETLNTLKFAQRAKLIQNNAVINEDSSGDVVALKHQIQLLKEELCALKREKVTRSLSFGQVIDTGNKDEEVCNEKNMPGKESHGVLRVSCKQLKSLETTLAGALRREQMAESTVRQLQAEIQQLNRLVSQREEDTRCTKMMLKFREDKIQRMESVVGGLISGDEYLERENNALLDEIQQLRDRIDKNPEVTRFAVENIRLLDQVRQFQDLYGEGEREMLMAEVSELRKQLISSLDGNSKHANHLDMKASNRNNNEYDLLHKELRTTLCELGDSKEKLDCCLEENAKLQREIEELHASLSVTAPAAHEHDCSAEVIKESIVEVPTTTNLSIMATWGEKEGTRPENLLNAEDVMNLQLELDIVKIILQEQRSSHAQAQEMAKSLNRELQSSKEIVISVTKNYEQVLEELKNTKLVIEALESQQIQSINEIEDLRNSNIRFEDLLKERELEISNLKEQARNHEFRDLSMYNKHSGSEDSPLEAKLKKMQISLEKAKKMNEFYQSDLAFQASHQNEVEEVRRQVEAETAEVIVCLQEELSSLQQEVYESKTKEMGTTENFTSLQTQMKIMEDDLRLRSEDNEKLSVQLKTMRSDWDLISCEIENILYGGNEALEDVSDEINVISSSFPHKQSLISEKFERLKKYVFEKELLITELNQCLKDALDRRGDMECMLKSLRGAALAITETHQQECSEKDKEIFLLTSELNSKTSTVEELRSLIEHGKEQLKTASSCAMAAFVIVNRLSELNSNNRDALDIVTKKDMILDDRTMMIDGAENEKNEILEKNREELKELYCGVSALKLSVIENVKQSGHFQKDKAPNNSVCDSATDDCKSRTASRIEDEIEYAFKSLHEVQAEMEGLRCEKEEILASKKCGQESIQSTIDQAVILGDAIDKFRDEFELKVNAMEGKMGKLEGILQDSFASWFQQRELLEDELDDAKVIAAQKTIEASCILEKFEEVQDTVKEADIMINELMIANESLKLNAHQSKVKENNLSKERDFLVKEVESLKLANCLKDQSYGNLEKQYDTDFDIMKRNLSELEDVVTEIQNTSVKEWMSLSFNLLSVKSQFQESTVSIRTMLEDVWSEIIAKDCVLTVFHLCYMGILLETANGLNAENGLLNHGLCESNSAISELRDHNLKSRKELEMCRDLNGKLLADIKKGFDRISSKVDENGEVILKVASFEKKIQNLQFQEEMMLKRSNDMGCELAAIMKELDFCNKDAVACIKDNERLLKEKDELLQYQEQSFEMELQAKDFEFLILSTELKQMSILKTSFENLKKDIVFNSLEAAACELMLLEKENEYGNLLESFEMKESALETSAGHNDRLLKEKDELLQYQEESCEIELQAKDFELLILSTELKQMSILKAAFENLKNDIVFKSLEAVSCELMLLEKENEYENLLENFEMKESARKIRELQNELEFGKISCLEKENEKLQLLLNESMAENHVLLHELEDKRVEIKNQEVSQRRIEDLQSQLSNVNALKEENILLRNEVRAYETNESEQLSALNLKILKNVELAENVDKICCRTRDLIEEKFVEADTKFQTIVNEMDKIYTFLEECENVKNIALQFDSGTSSLQMELLRKDDILKGLLFDLSLLQESVSNSKDQKDEIEKLLVSLRTMENDLELKSLELEKAVVESLILESELHEKVEKISSLELDLTNKNAKLLACAKETLDAKNSMEEEFLETRVKIESLEMEVGEMETALDQMSKTTESLKSNLDCVTCRRDELEGRVVILTKELEMARTLAGENEAIASEAQEIAEIQKVNAEEKEEEVKLLERSIEELESTINVLEQKVDIVKGEAERQRLQREELELELLGVQDQMQNIKNNDSDLKRCLDEKEKNLKDALQRVQLLEKEIASRDAEISQCKAHIRELNLHAEAQASEYKQKFKALEAMIEQLKFEACTNHSTSSPKKLEKSSSKPRGSGSPFKCIGLGLVNQIKSEKDEELNAGKQRIEELEALATSRQKEILMLKARLAATESMTHDVIRDLLGVKLNMKNYADLMDNQKLQSLMGQTQHQTQHHNVEAEVKEKEVAHLKQQINEFVKERNGWLEEIERKQAEMMSAHVALEKLRHAEQFLATENEMLKMENVNHKKKVMELEVEIKKLSGQQNIQQRIHHHAKIKEENNSLRCRNEDLSIKLRKSEAILSRVKEELAQFRAANGRNPNINFDEEQLLGKKLKETEEEKLQLAQKLLGLCTTVLKAAGITRPTSEINLSVAEEALVQLKNKVIYLEMELEDVKLKNRISDERMRLSELRPQTSTASSDENCSVRGRLSQTPFLSALDR